MRPAVIPKLSELPVQEDPDRSKAVLASAHAEPGPEQRPVSKKAHKVETVAATAAALIGLLFSKTQNVTLGGASVIDENSLGEKRKQKRKPGQAKQNGKAEDGEGGEDDAKVRPPEPVDSDTLIPWVRLK